MQHRGALALGLLLVAAAIGTRQAQAQTYTVLYTFNFNSYGGRPEAGVIRDSAGNLYGTTALGGGFSSGIIFRLDTTGTLTLLYSFNGAGGSTPRGNLIRDSAGNLYGATQGWLIEIRSGVQAGYDRHGERTIQLHGRADGAHPNAALIRDSAGNLYSTTPRGGGGNGVVFKVDTAGKETVLYSFTGGTDGAEPTGGVIQDSAGNLYGTTHGGGASNFGVVFKLATTGKETVLYSFTGGLDGASPVAGAVLDPAGNLYGTTNRGGASNFGVVFKLDTTGKETVI